MNILESYLFIILAVCIFFYHGEFHIFEYWLWEKLFLHELMIMLFVRNNYFNLIQVEVKVELNSFVYLNTKCKKS